MGAGMTAERQFFRVPSDGFNRSKRFRRERRVPVRMEAGHPLFHRMR